MALNLRTAVRRTAFAAAVGGTALLAMFPAAAQEVRKTAATPTIAANTNCHDYKPGELMATTECEILKGQVLDNDLAKARETLGCMQKIKRFLDQGKVSRETIIQYGKERACELAKTLG